LLSGSGWWQGFAGGRAPRDPDAAAEDSPRGCHPMASAAVSRKTLPTTAKRTVANRTSWRIPHAPAKRRTGSSTPMEPSAPEAQTCRQRCRRRSRAKPGSAETHEGSLDFDGKGSGSSATFLQSAVAWKKNPWSVARPKSITEVIEPLGVRRLAAAFEAATQATTDISGSVGGSNSTLFPIQPGSRSKLNFAVDFGVSSAPVG
jgi:hypothetical protein